MGIYGHTWDKYRTDLVYINEMYLSKQDLQDPKILKKVLQKSKEETKNKNGAIMSVCTVLGIAADIVVGIISGSILLSIGLFIPFIVGSLVLACSVMQDRGQVENKNIDKLVKQVQDLRNKTMKLKDSPDKKKIINNCDKILNSVNKYKNDKEISIQKKEIERIEKDINHLINCSKGSDCPSGYISEIYKDYIFAKELGIASPSQMDSGVIKCCKNEAKHADTSALEYFYGYNKYEEALKDIGNDLEAVAKKIPGFREVTPIVDLLAIDDTIIFFNPKDNKFYESGYDASSTISNSSLWGLCNQILKHDDYYNPSDEEITKYKEVYENMKK